VIRFFILVGAVAVIIGLSPAVSAPIKAEPAFTPAYCRPPGWVDMVFTKIGARADFIWRQDGKWLVTGEILEPEALADHGFNLEKESKYFIQVYQVSDDRFHVIVCPGFGSGRPTQGEIELETEESEAETQPVPVELDQKPNAKRFRH
jgi:hypothetical protein